MNTNKWHDKNREYTFVSFLQGSHFLDALAYPGHDGVTWFLQNPLLSL